MTTVSVVTVAYGAEPWLEPSVEASLASVGVDVDVVVVDNGCTDEAVGRLEGRPRVKVVRPGRNLGFADGCNAGVAAATGDVVALVNPDARVEPPALAALAAAALAADVGIATASVRLAHDPERLNSAGNVVHYTGVSWSGWYGELAADHVAPRDATAASGAGMAFRRQVWHDLGGFEPAFFAYYEDADLSLRCWQRGLRVVYIPGAVVVHRYEFSRNPEKYFLLERNRLVMVLSCYGGRTLALLAPVLLALEIGTLAMAIMQGWAPQKARSWVWLARHGRWLARRRRRLQDGRVVADRELAHLLAAALVPANLPLPPGLRLVNPLLVAYWRLVCRAL